MANAASNELRIQALEDLIGNSTEPKNIEVTSISQDDLVVIQKVGQPVQSIKASLLSTMLNTMTDLGLKIIYRIDDDPLKNGVTAIGQYCIGTKTGINDGFEFRGEVNTFPPTQNSHITNLINT